LGIETSFAKQERKFAARSQLPPAEIYTFPERRTSQRKAEWISLLPHANACLASEMHG